jgi:hypothetical protein
MSKIFLATTLATLLCASLAAQANRPQDPSAPPRVAPPAAGADTTPADPQSAAKKADSIAVEGCIQRGTSGRPAGTSGTTGQAAPAFMLTSAGKPAGSTSTAPVASSYQLDAADSKLTPHVGHKVEITGTLDQASAAPGAPPKLKVDNVKMIAANCTP